jgi:tetratricopeptide (TPR) repeat protein
MFCWGSGPGGRRWQDYLSLPGEEYLELQAGLAPTQLHTSTIRGGSSLDWVQGFTALNLDPQVAHQKNYREAAAYTGDQLANCISPADLDRVLAAGRQGQGTPVRECLALGSGWGALEKQGVPEALSFPGESIGTDEQPWLELLTGGSLPMRSLEEGPGSFVCQAEPWEALLEKSLGREGDWLSPYHLGVIALERGEIAKAKSWWEQSLAARENPWAYRNLAIASLREGKPDAALDYYRKIFDRFGQNTLDTSFAEEFIPLLIEQGREEEAAAALDTYAAKAGNAACNEVPRAAILSSPLADALAVLAFKRRDDALLDAIFAHEPVHIREGNTVLFDLWTQREVRRLSERDGLTREEADQLVRESVKTGKLPPPRQIDFRMFT